jgi:anthranilate phosphoribosyltransferase
MAPIMAGVLAERGVQALVFRADDGLDELATTSPSDVWVVGGGSVRPDRFDALDVGMTRAELTDLVGGDPAHNAQVVRDVLAGAKGAIRDAVLLSAAAALVAADGSAVEGRLTEA